MKGLRGLFRLGTLTLLALTLMVAMALPSAAADVCSPSQMLDEVEIVSVAAKEAPSTWSAQDLVDFDYDGDIDNGLLEVSFKDIPTDFDFDGYIIEAVPGDDDPGTSDALGVPDYKSPSLIARPAVVGSTVTEVLNLEPGTKYYVTIYAVNHNTVQISPDQRAQDSSSATTLLSAPFLGALDWAIVHAATVDTAGQRCVAADFTTPVAGCVADADAGTDGLQPTMSWANAKLADPEFEGTHFAIYGATGQAGQHYFRWLNPAIYGPFDHVPNSDGEQVDMLSLDDEGDVEDPCDTVGGDCGHTHYQFKAVDENGKLQASELYETNGVFATDNPLVLVDPGTVTQAELDTMNAAKDFFEVVFTAESGDLTLSISLGRMVSGRYKAMSDIASVTFEAPDDLELLDQTYAEYLATNNGIAGDVTEADDVEAYLDSLFGPHSEYADLTDNQAKVLAYINNQLK
jgi:hypothetical protein